MGIRFCFACHAFCGSDPHLSNSLHPIFMVKIKRSLFEAESKTLNILRKEAKDCRNCDLWKNGTQTVFGEGAEHAKVMIVGEQPGDQEDLQGRPFVGPAGNLMDILLEEAGIDRSRALCDKCGETLQMGAPRQTPYSQEAKFRRDSVVQADGSKRKLRPFGQEPSSAWSNCRASSTGKEFSGNRAPWRICVNDLRRTDHGDRTPFGDFTRSDR